jgi:hypothetical protein
MTEAHPASETSCNLNIPKTMDSAQRNNLKWTYMRITVFSVLFGGTCSAPKQHLLRAFALCWSVLASTETNVLLFASNKSKSISAHGISVVVMAEADEDVAVLLWYCWEKIYMGEKRKLLWVHPINEKSEKENTLQNFLHKLRCDENKFQNFQDYP